RQGAYPCLSVIPVHRGEEPAGETAGKARSVSDSPGAGGTIPTTLIRGVRRFISKSRWQLKSLIDCGTRLLVSCAPQAKHNRAAWKDAARARILVGNGINGSILTAVPFAMQELGNGCQATRFSRLSPSNVRFWYPASSLSERRGVS